VALLGAIHPVYLVIAVIWSAYQGFRGAVEQRLGNAGAKWKGWERWVVLYVHDFAFRFICTAAGFVALYAVYWLVGGLAQLASLSAATATLVGFLFIVGVIGVGGQLHYVVLLGKVPK
jgi:hypothetical protein